jgi:hypothetical protein
VLKNRSFLGHSNADDQASIAMTTRVLGRIIRFAVALLLGGAIVFVQPSSARAADRHAPTASADRGSAYSKRVDAEIARLQKKLHITTAQMPQWSTLAAAMRENAKGIRLSRADRTKIHPTNVIDELYSDRRETQAQLERLERIIPVAEALFAVLTADQKAKADALFGGLLRHHKPILDTRDWK